MMGVLQAFQYGLKSYRDGQFDQALKAFAEGANLNPGDAATRMYMQRCDYLKEHPPGDAWDGVWVMKTK
jgi:adenylate cyclase